MYLQENPLMDDLSVMDNLRLWYGGRSQVAQALESQTLSMLDLKNILNRKVSRTIWQSEKASKHCMCYCGKSADFNFR